MVVPLPEDPVTLLLVSSQASDRSSLARILAPSNWNLRVRMTCRDGLALLREISMPVVICDSESAGC